MTKQFETTTEYHEDVMRANREKPIVHYIVREGNYIVVGQSAEITVTDHPASYLNSARYVVTTRVEDYDEETGEFETRNTKYVPVSAS